jgi:shikimate kinase
MSAGQIFIVGFMASGKSTVGPLLAAQLGRPFIDLDVLIEAQAGCTIFEMVRQQGEAPFRELEAATLLRIAQGEPAVIAPGGGAITQAPNREVMRRYGVTIWFDTPFELCWQRIVQDGATRPLAPDEATARARYEARLPLYQASNVRIEMGNNVSAEDLVKQARLALAHRN